MDGGRAQGTTEEGGTSEKPLILVIEDDAVMQELLRLHLTNAGYKVLVAENGIAGGYLVLSGKPDLLLVDVDMPYMSGYELVEAVKADPLTRHIPAVFLTSRDDVYERTALLGAEAYLQKPVKVDRLLEMLGRFTPERRSERSGGTPGGVIPSR